MATHAAPCSNPPRTARRSSAGWVCALALCAAGCSQVSVRPAGGPALLDDWRASAVSASELSPRTLQTLHALDLDATYRASPAQVLTALHALAMRAPQPELLFALAELSYLLGTRTEGANESDACAYYYLSAGYAYHYLFGDVGPGEPASPFDPRFRLACDLYNTSLARCLRVAQRNRKLDPRCQFHLACPGGADGVLQVKHFGFAWREDEFGPVLFCADYRAVGIEEHRTYGLGVPLICTRQGSSEAPGRAFYPPGVSFPATAFFRFEGTVADLGARHAGWLELYNPLAVQQVTVRGRPVALETDLSTPVAYFLAHTRLQAAAVTGFLDADRLKNQSGIYLAEPYQPGKIPVLFVHGLLSEPLTWATMYNDLLADPVLRARYQFWFYFYPTGAPYLETAARLRDDLRALRGALDPGRRDPALDRMVCVGHSMGGLVARLLTVDSGDAFWRLVSPAPVQLAALRPGTREELQRVFFFEPEPAVRRVIFLGTPHHGSSLSRLPVARLADSFVRLPADLMQAAQDLMRQGEKPSLTSVDLLDPASPALQVLARLPAAAGVHYHSIIGEAPCGNALREVTWFLGQGKERTDGVVPYASAHLDGVDSEIIVAADHLHIQQHPLAVLEVRRILREHLRTPPGGP